MFGALIKYNLYHTNIIKLFFEQFGKETDPNVHVVMVWDQAGFQPSKDLKVSGNITIVPLPAYSPELNPVENLWHYLRSHYWANRIYDDYDDLRLAAIHGWQNAALNSEIIKSVCRVPYVKLPKLNTSGTICLAH